MQERPKVSIGLLVYNEAANVRAAIESILGQPYGDYELIVADNASDDGSSDIVRELAAREPRILHVQRTRNIGALANLNDALQRARGEYFVLAGGHDLWSENYLGALAAALDTAPAAVLAFTPTQWLDERGNRLAIPTSIVETTGMSRVGRFVALMQTNQHYLYGMMRTAAAHRVGGQRAVVGSGELFLQELAQLGDFVLVPSERWYRRRVRVEESVLARLPRYQSALFGSRAARMRMRIFPHMQMMLIYCALPFLMQSTPISARLGMMLAYPLIVARFLRLLPTDIAWLLGL